MQLGVLTRHKKTSILVAIVAVILLWLTRRKKQPTASQPPAIKLQPEKAKQQERVQPGQELGLPNGSLHAVEGSSEPEPVTGAGAKSKRQEKKELRKEKQKARDISAPLVRDPLAKYKSFLDQCEAAGIVIADSDIEQVYPKRFESHSHVVVVQLNGGGDSSTTATEALTSSAAATAAETSNFKTADAQKESFRSIVGPFAKSLPSSTDVVVVDTQGIGGELRKPIHEVLWQDGEAAAASAAKCFSPIKAAAPAGRYDGYSPSTTFTTHIENKTRYSFDVMKVMFSSGNTEIRMHFGTIMAADEIVVDMFAGIGYFTLPLAIHGKPRMIHALEKNPDSAEFLQMNAYQNGVADRVTVYCGDNRQVAGASLDGQCDRVLMGYIPSCKEFIPKAFQFLKKKVAVAKAVEVNASPSPSPNRGGRKGKKGKKHSVDEDANIEETAAVAEEGAPIGVIHYHYLAGKDDAEAVALADVASGVPPCLVANTDYKVTRIFQVKSYRPKVWHYVADITFGK